MTLQQCKDEILALDPNERAELARTLIQSLEQVPDLSYEYELDREIERRVQEIEDGAAVGRPAFAALEEVRNRLK